MISTTDILQKLSASSCLIALKGAFRERQKGSRSGNPFSALIPHYAEGGNRHVAYVGDTADPAAIAMNGAEIEAVLQISIQDYPYPEVFTGQAPSYFTQLQYGNRGLAPTPDELDFLLESSRTFRSFIGRPIILVGVPVLVSGQMVTLGRMFPVAIFSDSGDLLWLEPRAVEKGLVRAEFPAAQRIRKLGAPMPAGGASASAKHWFEEALAKAQEEGMTGAEATHRALDIRVEFIAGQGFDPNDVRPKVYEQYRTYAEQTYGMALPAPWKGKATSAKSAPAKAPAPAKSEGLAKQAAMGDLKRPKK